MGMVIDFEFGAVAQLKKRVARVEEDNRDLLAFARGHSGIVAAIHRAVLAAMEVQDLDHLIHVVTQEWPDLLGVDAVSLALSLDSAAIRADTTGVQPIEPRLAARAAEGISGVVARDVGCGHPLFGPASELIRAETLIQIANEPPLPSGLLALGQRDAKRIEPRQESEALLFLGAALARVISRWFP